MIRIRYLTYTLFLIAGPSLLVYFYYDSFNVYNFNRDSHKYAALWQSKNVDGFEMQRAAMPTSDESRDPDPEIERRRQFVKEMMKEAWSNYVQYAWGENELRPLSHSPKRDSIFGEAKIGLTLVDSMDTLFLMDMKEEFERGRQWIANNFLFNATTNEVSVFETVIRYVGGLLSCYAFTGDKLFLTKSREVAQALLPAYQTKTGLPSGLIVPKTGKHYHHSWAQGSILSEMGSHHLEYVYLSDMTGDMRFRKRANHIRNFLNNIQKPNGLYMLMVDSEHGVWSENRSSLGALGDSFYEYLIKSYIQSGGQDHLALKMYKDAMDAIESNGIISRSRTGLTYANDLVFGQPNNKMQHLTCFAGGMFALGSQYFQNQTNNNTTTTSTTTKHQSNKNLSNVTTDSTVVVADQSTNFNYSPTENNRAKRHFELGANITETCHQSYSRSSTGLGPETFYFDDSNDATNQFGDIYILRPETVESYFVMWRLTHDVRYREYAWQATEALYKYCRTGSGYSGLYNVMKVPPVHDNTQQSFFLAETLKYLYLIFSNDQLLPLDQWVFNTEAHPLPVCGNNLAYPKSMYAG